MFGNGCETLSYSITYTRNGRKSHEGLLSFSDFDIFVFQIFSWSLPNSRTRKPNRDTKVFKILNFNGKIFTYLFFASN